MILRAFSSGLLGALLLVRLATAQGEPFVLEEAELAASDATQDDFVGQSVAVSGDHAIVGGSGVDGPAGTHYGGAYIFVRNGIAWHQQAKLVALDGAPSDNLGSAVAISGDTALVGAPGHSGPAFQSGAAYIFVRTGSLWIQQAELIASDGASFDVFGTAVALSGNTAVVGAPNNDQAGGNNDGAVYVFTRVGQVWSEQAKLVVPGLGFGASVALDDDTLLVGGGADGTGVGAAHVFRRSGGVWTEDAKLVPANAAADQAFGAAVALHNGTALIGAPNYSQSTGAAYIFTDGPTGWTESTTLAAPGVSSGDGFGFSVALAEGVALVGAQTHTSSGLAQSGSSYLFEEAASAWTLRQEVLPADQAESALFGRSVSLDGDTAVVGAMLAEVGPFVDAGAAYVFRIGPFGNFVDLGSGLGGTAGVPLLTAAGYLKANLPISLDVSSARAFSMAPFVVGVAQINAPFKGGTMVPTPSLVFPLFTNFFGSASFGGLWPPGLPPGTQIYFQWWIQDLAGPKGFAASNAVAGTTP